MKKLLLIFLIFIITSCTTTKYVEVPVKHTEIEYRDKIKYDSIYLRDSTIQREKDNTLYIEKYKYLYKYLFLKDTVNIIDTVPVIQVQEVVKEVNKLHNWQAVLMILGGGFTMIAGYKLIKIIKI